METYNIIKELKYILELLETKRKKEDLLSETQKKLNVKANNKFNELEEFDKIYKDYYIRSKIGDKPIYIEPKIKLPNFVNKAKSEYQQKLQKYNNDYKKAELDFFEHYKEKRERLRKEDEKNRSEYKIKIQKEYDSLILDINSINSKLEQITIISRTYFEIKVINRIVSYFEDNRVDTIKEAINLYHEEKRLEEERILAIKHREKVEKMIQELRDDMDDLISRVDDKLENFDFELSSLHSKIEEAYIKAEEAYSKADDAYWNNNNY